MQSNDHSPEQSSDGSIPEEVRAHIEALTNSAPSVRSPAAAARSEIGDAHTVPELTKALVDSNITGRWAAVVALGKAGDVCAVPALMEALKDSDTDVRRSAAEALGKIGGTHAVPTLIKALKDNNPFVHGRAAEALGKIGADAVPALIKALKDSDASVRWGAAEALGKIGDVQTLPLRILSNALLTPAAKLDTLEALRRIQYREKHYRDETVTLRYRLPSIPTYCQNLLNRADVEAEVRDGA